MHEWYVSIPFVYLDPIYCLVNKVTIIQGKIFKFLVLFQLQLKILRYWIYKVISVIMNDFNNVPRRGEWSI